jgi:hypothetical protein
MDFHAKAVHVEAGRKDLEHVEHRVRAALERFSHRISLAEVSIIDINGPRGGRDKSLRLRVRMRPRGSLYIEETDADIRTAADRAADRAALAVSRALERRRTLRRGRGARIEAL